MQQDGSHRTWQLLTSVDAKCAIQIRINIVCYLSPNKLSKGVFCTPPEEVTTRYNTKLWHLLLQ